MPIMFSNIKFYATFILLFTLSIACSNCNINRKESPVVKNPELLKMTSIKVPEPSGLALSFDGNNFWAVGDEQSIIYKLDKTGIIISSFEVIGEDLEGITVIDSEKLVVVFERTREVAIVDTSGKEITRKKFDLEGKLNEGLEGICYDDKNKNFYLVNEKDPGLLIKTDENFNELYRKEINFAKDFSDIYYSKDDSTLWILSDESKKIIQTDLEGNRLKEYYINVTQPEGLVVDYKNKKIFVVCDKTEALYEFSLP
jgi:uncharacterized protein YjiK